MTKLKMQFDTILIILSAGKLMIDISTN